MVAAIPNTVLIAIALNILTILLVDIKEPPFSVVKIMKHKVKANTAAQLTKNFPILNLPFIFKFINFTP